MSSKPLSPACTWSSWPKYSANAERMDVHCLESGCIGKYIPLGPRDCPRQCTDTVWPREGCQYIDQNILAILKAVYAGCHNWGSLHWSRQQHIHIPLCYLQYTGLDGLFLTLCCLMHKSFLQTHALSALPFHWTWDTFSPSKCLR